MNAFFQEIAWWNMLEADIQNAHQATDFVEREEFCKAAVRDRMQYECIAAQYWTGVSHE